jgi:ankyrin repeat protein
LLAAGADARVKNKDGIGAYQLALLCGLTDVAEALEKAGAVEALSPEDRFVAACARCDAQAARSILKHQPDIFGRLSEIQLRQLPNLLEARKKDAARLMVELGWPIGVQGGDWRASALNLAVFQGDSEMTRFLLEHGASWTERHGFADNVNGTLSWTTRNHAPAQGDWVGCARALVEHGMPLDLAGDYSEEVANFFAEERAKQQTNA